VHALLLSPSEARAAGALAQALAACASGWKPVAVSLRPFREAELSREGARAAPALLARLLLSSAKRKTCLPCPARPYALGARARAPAAPRAGDAFLCVTGAAKIKVYDRDGVERAESVLGDPYIRDTKNTKGHQSPCTSGHWHPTDRCGRRRRGRARGAAPCP